MQVVAGIDLGGTAINFTLVDKDANILITSLFEHPARTKEGPAICLAQIQDGLKLALKSVGLEDSDVVAVGLDTPGPASADGILSVRGSTNFVHAGWANFDMRGQLEALLGKPTVYLNDGNAAAYWGHFQIFGTEIASSVSAVIGTGLGGGIIHDGCIVVGRRGFGGEVGHMLIPYHLIPDIAGMVPICNCGRTGDLESLCSLTAIGKTILPYFLPRYPDHPLSKMDIGKAAKLVRTLADEGDALSRDVFRVQARAMGLFFDGIVNALDPDALIVGGGAIEASAKFQEWFISEIRAGMPTQRAEQANIPIQIMPNGDTAGARGAAMEVLRFARLKKLL